MVDLANELEGKVAIVTGSARNIGQATAEELARAGAAVVVNAVQAQDLCEQVAAGICAAGGRAIPVMADVTDPDAVQAMAQAAIQAFGGIDILVCNAANRSNTSFDDLDWDTWQRTIDISIHGTFHLAKAVVPSMRQRGGGCIVGVGGMSSLRGAKGRSHVMAAKMGMNAFIRGLALELAQDGIRANQVVVGNFDTIRENNPSSASAAEIAAMGPVNIPLGRKGAPQDMANLIRFVVGPGAAYMTGQTIHCNGGAYMNL